MIDSSMSNLVTSDDGSRLATVEEAAANDARLVRCDCMGRVATVEVEVATHGLGRLGGPAHGTARAEVRPECLLGCGQPP